MGPSIILDKSALQGLGLSALSELGRYFYSVITQTLLAEILADLTVDPSDLAASKQEVGKIASKLMPADGCVSADYGYLCTANLLGHQVPLDRTPIVTHGLVAATADGDEAVCLGPQPERIASHRWSNGIFSESDLAFALRWRQQIDTQQFDSTLPSLPKPPYALTSLDDLQRFVDKMLSSEIGQLDLLNILCRILCLSPETTNQVLGRYNDGGYRSIKAFAPYSHHCLRVHMLLYLGMSHRLIGTRNSNIIDIQYFCYSPFTCIFCSGDDLHAGLAKYVLTNDQSFVPLKTFQEALTDLGDRRLQAQGAGAPEESVEPEPESLVHRLWMKHWGHFTQPKRRTLSSEESTRIMKAIKPVVDAVKRAPRSSQAPHWPG